MKHSFTKLLCWQLMGSQGKGNVQILKVTLRALDHKSFSLWGKTKSKPAFFPAAQLVQLSLKKLRLCPFFYFQDIPFILLLVSSLFQLLFHEMVLALIPFPIASRRFNDNLWNIPTGRSNIHLAELCQLHRDQARVFLLQHPTEAVF